MLDLTCYFSRRRGVLFCVGIVGLWLSACAPTAEPGSLTDRECGYGIAETGETCDDGNQVTEECAPYLGTCEICDDTCELKTIENTSDCGNGIVEGSEECDDGNQVTEECSRPGESCRACDATCRYTRRQAMSVCGNGVHEIPEQCDSGSDVDPLCEYGLPSCQIC